ncbi:helix-turn-helix domain-containing protein [Caulobacter sp. 1776]|uniref:helix-turn-helix domain-containing protein n=1 Tax=Caulobacter sp. 1776 TaxID=3156420 RepID=UPI00339ACE78
MPFQLLSNPRSRLAPEPAALEAFGRLARLSRFGAGEDIFAQEAQATGYYRLVKGVARGTRLLVDGRRQVSAFYFPGDMFGLEIGAIHLNAVEALSDCEVQIVKRAALAAAPDGPRIERLVWQVTSQQLEGAHERMLLLARHNAYEKVACFLMEIARRGEGPWANLAMSRQDIADYLGLTIETVSRMLTQLQHDGVVALDGSRRFRMSPRRETAGNLAA